MSVSVTTYEELRVNNVNNSTAELLRSVAEYLTKVWGIISLRLTLDGTSYETRIIDGISEDNELETAVGKMPEANEITLALRTCNGSNASWSPFVQLLNKNSDLIGLVTYRSIEYYDTDAYVDTCVFDEKGLHEADWSDDIDAVRDIKKWFSNTPVLSIIDDEQNASNEVYETLMDKVRMLYCDCFGWQEEEFNDLCDDNWDDYSEIVLNGTVSFSSEKITEIKNLCNEIADIAADSELSLELEIVAVPDGDDDYDFASLCLKYDGEKINLTSCRF